MSSKYSSNSSSLLTCQQWNVAFGTENNSHRNTRFDLSSNFSKLNTANACRFLTYIILTYSSVSYPHPTLHMVDDKYCSRFKLETAKCAILEKQTICKSQQTVTKHLMAVQTNGMESSGSKLALPSCYNSFDNKYAFISKRGLFKYIS